jgi:hypothetical protein
MNRVHVRCPNCRRLWAAPRLKSTAPEPRWQRLCCPYCRRPNEAWVCTYRRSPSRPARLRKVWLPALRMLSLVVKCLI